MKEIENKTDKPLISIIIEGYNESLELGTTKDVVDALKKQSFPADQVEVILVGSERQAAGWKEMFAEETSFFSIETFGNDNFHYYQLKNKGAEIASAEILALTDSDVVPELDWIENIYRGIKEKGGDVLVGISLFRDGNNFLDPDNAVLQTAASVYWGYVVPRDGTSIPNSFLSHNLGIRSEVFAKHKYRTDLGRTLAGSFFFDSLLESGAKVVFQPNQKIAHNFTLWWWISRLHLRFGYEIFLLRRVNKYYPNKLLAKLSLLEPLTSFFWHILLDVPLWFRFGRFLNLTYFRRVYLLPLLIFMSFLASGGEMIGMYMTIFFPKKMKRRAEKS